MQQHLGGSVISAVNVSEVGAKLIERGATLISIRTSLAFMGLEIVPFDTELAYAASDLRAVTKSHRLSLGDRACLALARRRNLPALTADHAWTRVDVGVKIEMIRSRPAT